MRHDPSITLLARSLPGIPSSHRRQECTEICSLVATLLQKDHRLQGAFLSPLDTKLTSTSLPSDQPDSVLIQPRRDAHSAAPLKPFETFQAATHNRAALSADSRHIPVPLD